MKFKGWVDGIVGTRTKADIASVNWYAVKVVPDMIRSTLVITNERVFTESEVDAYVKAMFKAQFDPGAFTERHREEKVIGQPFEETATQWIERAKRVVRNAYGFTDPPKE